MGEVCNTLGEILVEKFKGKRKVGKSRRRWKNNIALISGE
jgi:hypothetical protein